MLERKSVSRAEAGQTSSEVLIDVSYKCNYDLNFVQEVAEKIDFKLNEYLL